MNHSIRVAARITGLSPHAIRAWEKRYGAVAPRRTGSRYRLYSEADLERLQLLRRATQAGHAIRNLARLPTAALRRLTASSPAPPSPGADRGESPSEPGGGKFTGEAIAAVRSLSAPALEAALNRAALALGHQGLLRHVIGPLVEAVGGLWKEGTVTAAHEHFATVVIRSFLLGSTRPFAASGDAPNLLVATPAGQLHELGAVLVAAAAANDGWRVTYLGASLPAAEIAGAVRQSAGRAVALSLVYPEDDPGLPGELDRLRGHLPEIPFLVGGRAAPAYRETLDRIGALYCEDLADLYRHLGRLRTPTRKRSR